MASQASTYVQSAEASAAPVTLRVPAQRRKSSPVGKSGAMGTKITFSLCRAAEGNFDMFQHQSLREVDVIYDIKWRGVSSCIVTPCSSVRMARWAE